MSFPASPTNGQSAVINGITYTYSTSTISWTRQLTANTSTSVYTSFVSILNSTASTGTSTGALVVKGGAGISGTVNAGNVTVASALTMGSWSTSTRPSNVTNGTIGYNSDLSGIEVYMGSNWYTIMTQSTYTVSYLIVAGGGAGGGTNAGNAGGGGGGGFLAGTSLSVTAGTTYSITVGAGASYPGSTTPGTTPTWNGSNSKIGTLVNGSTGAVGGGGGGTYAGAPTSGGSGGGIGQFAGGGYWTGTGGAGTSGQGNNGGGIGSSGTPIGAGGGGGAGAVGGNTSGTSGENGGAGGVGLTSSLSGTSTYYAGGGGGSTHSSGTGIASGGTGGGGNGHYTATAGTSGTANTGGGGGGAGENVGGGNGGSGIVILSYANATQRGTGGTVTTYNSGAITYYVHSFTTSGTFSYTA